MRTKYALADLYLAHAVAKWAHDGQVRLDGEDYVAHCERVSAAATNFLANAHVAPFILARAKLVGYLHDVLEDTAVSRETLENLFGDDVARDVHTLTRDADEHEPYNFYVERVTRSPSVTVLVVKRADLRDNIPNCPSPRLLKRYEPALAALNRELRRRGYALT